MTIQKNKAIITLIKELSPVVKKFVLDLDTEDFQFQAGQFANLIINDNGKEIKRAYSISSKPDKDNTNIEFCIKLVQKGEFTPKLWDKKEGDELEVQGPLGLFTLRNKKEKLVFIGTGTGIAPLKSMILDELSKQNELLESDVEEGVTNSKEIILIFGVRFENEILYKEEFEELENKNPNFKFIPVVSKPTDDWQGRQGHVQDNFEMIDINNSEIYICGHPLMFEGAKEKLLSLGILEEDISHEVFR